METNKITTEIIEYIVSSRMDEKNVSDTRRVTSEMIEYVVSSNSQGKKLIKTPSSYGFDEGLYGFGDSVYGFWDGEERK